ncbi:SgcJ/EcaC family oxidoreductase [bacterium]|nr:SgcJ/EcaC family oxidoreductase [bacterium]
MNRRNSIIKGLTGIAAISAITTKATAQEVKQDNPDLDQIRAVLKAHDAAMAQHDIAGVLAVMAPKAVIMGSGPGEVWSGPEEFKEAYGHFFADFDKGEQDFTYNVRFGGLSPEMGWLMASGEVNAKKDGKAFAFPLNISLTVSKMDGKWLIAGLHFSTLTGPHAAK